MLKQDVLYDIGTWHFLHLAALALSETKRDIKQDRVTLLALFNMQKLEKLHKAHLFSF